jgi:hypothetical protein
MRISPSVSEAVSQASGRLLKAQQETLDVRFEIAVSHEAGDGDEDA